MKKPHRIIRTTLGEYFASKEPYNGNGVYVIACYPSLGCLYVGKSKAVYERLRYHFGDRNEALSGFLKAVMEDSCRFRLDILTPENQNDHEWVDNAERALINHFRPQFNTRGAHSHQYENTAMKQKRLW